MNEMRKLMEAVNGISDEDFTRTKVNEDYDDIVEELRGIQQEMLELLGQAQNLVSGTSEERAAESYWIPHIQTALTSQHGYLGGSMHSLDDTIDALLQAGGPDDDEDDDDGSLEAAARANEM